MSEQKTINKSTDSKSKSTNKNNDKKGPQRLDPVRYGDWEKNGRCIDF